MVSLESLGFPSVVLGQKLSAWAPDCLQLEAPSAIERARARGTLVNLRISDPKYKDPTKQFRRHIRSKARTQQLANPDNWTFDLREIGRAVDSYLRQQEWDPVGVLLALLESGDGASAPELWRQYNMEEPKILGRRKPKPVPPFPWLDMAAENGHLNSAKALAGAPDMYAYLNSALYRALDRKNSDIAAVLLARGAEVDLTEPRRSSQVNYAKTADPEFFNPWFLAPGAPNRGFILGAMAVAVGSSPTNLAKRRVLAHLLANQRPSVGTAYLLLVKAIESENLWAIAAISTSIGHDWSCLHGHGEKATSAAANMPDPQSRYRVLNFLLSSGARPDTYDLARRLFTDGTRGDLTAVQTLVSSGVSPHHADANLLEWTVAHPEENIRAFDILMGARIPAERATAAVYHLPDTASKAIKSRIIQGLAKKGAEKTALSTLILRSTKACECEVIDTLIHCGAYVDYDEGNALTQAAETCPVRLVKALLRGTPSKRTMERAFAAAATRNFRLEKFHVLELLLGCKIEEDQVSQALVRVVHQDPSDSSIPDLLLRHGANPNFKGGLAVRHAIREASPELTSMLCCADLSESTATSAFREVTDSVAESTRRLDLYHKLLPKRIAQDAIDAALLHTCRQRADIPTVFLLLDHKASVDHMNGTTLVTIVKSQDISLLCHVLDRADKAPTTKTYSRAFKVALLQPKLRRKLAVHVLRSRGTDTGEIPMHLDDVVATHDIDLLYTILEGGPVDWNLAPNCLRHAVKNRLLKAVRLLLQYDAPLSMVSEAFQMEVEAVDAENDPLRMEIATALMYMGLGSEVLNTALVNAFRGVPRALPEKFISLLLQYGANPSASDSTCFTTAALAGNEAVYMNLCKESCDANAISTAILKSIGSAREAVGWLRLYFENAMVAGLENITEEVGRLAIDRFPTDAQVFSLLVERGCPLGFMLHSANTSEDITPLIWALGGNVRASDEVILYFLSHESSVNSNFLPSRSAMSAIHIAAKHGRSDVMRRLLELGADIDVPNSEGFTPQCVAAQGGHTETIRVLFDAGAGSNDGSLHIACRAPNIECIKLLQGLGHDMLYPIDVLDGRVALAELCHSGCGSGAVWENRVERAMQLLIPFPDPTWRIDGKTVLHMAIDNPHAAVSIVRAFLRVAQLWRNPTRDDDYSYVEPGTKLHYSVTSYVQHLCGHKTQQERSELTRLLKSSQFTDRFYAEAGQQPAGATGLPEELRRAEQENEQAKWKQQQELRRIDETAAHQARKDEELHAKTLRYMEMQAESDIALTKRRGASEREEERRKQEERREASRLNHKQDMAQHLERQGAVQELQLEYEARAQKQQRAHAEKLEKQKARAMRLETQTQRERFTLEEAHHERMAAQQVELMAIQGAARKAIEYPGSSGESSGGVRRYSSEEVD